MTTSQTPSGSPSRGPEPSRSEPGYRGSLPSREDRLARPWILVVIGIFILVVVFSVAGVPSRFIPEPTVPPLPSLPPASGSVEPSPSGSAEASASASASAEASAEASPSGE
ncbi:MAG: hypothetical protein ACRDGB_07600 [Candidatus Limnocylindria bacterium]